jgi:DNA-directed RNA polymerase subunit M/transcription elongation factor TFIIS
MTDLRAYGLDMLSALIGQSMSIELEECIFRYAISESKCDLNYPTWDHVAVRGRYKEKLKMLLENITNPNVTLKERLLEGKIAIPEVPFLSHEELRPSIWMFGTDSPSSEVQEESNDSQLKCNNCQRRGFPCYNTEYREFQTRAGDESTTIYAFCRTCLKRWKFS